MAATVRIPTPLQRHVNNQPEVQVEGATVAQLLDNMEATYPGIKERICDADGKVRRFLNIYVAEEDSRFQQNEATPVPDGAEVSIIPAIAGG